MFNKRILMRWSGVQKPFAYVMNISSASQSVVGCQYATIKLSIITNNNMAAFNTILNAQNMSGVGSA